MCFGNGSPKALYDKSEGSARRLLILTTKPKPVDRRDDPFLADKFISEKERIFCWMLDGLRHLKKNNFRFTENKKTKENVAEAVAENCNIVDFIAEAAVFSESFAVSSTTLHRVYTDWCADNGLTALKRETFINWLKSKEHSLCPSESAVPLMLVVACENQCQEYYGVTVGTIVKIPQRKEIIAMSEKRLSHCQGKGSLTHNNRKFNAKNVDGTRTKDNVVFIQQPIGETYEQLFSQAVERYNAKQKRADRKITKSYYEHTFKREITQSVVTAADKRKSFYEDVVQIGDMKNTGIGYSRR